MDIMYKDVLIFTILILTLFLLINPKKNLPINNIFEGFLNRDKIAFIFLTIDDVNHPIIWKEFFKNNEDKYNIYVHPKNPENVTSFFKNHIIDDLIPTQWGDVSLVDATNLLISRALKNKSNKKIILVSNSCIPIKKFSYVYNVVLEDDKSWLNFYKPDYVQGSKEHLRRMNMIEPKFKKSAYINEQWMILSRKHAELLEKNKKLIKYFRKPTLIPDELYYITMLHYLDKDVRKNLRFDIVSRRNYLKHDYITYAKWFDDRTYKWQTKHPFEYTTMEKHDILKIKSSKALFARKFSPESDIKKYWKYIIE